MNSARPFHCPDAVQDARDVDNGPAFIDINNASLHYGNDDRGLLALKDTFLAIGRGEFAAVVGPSGCGKSTLMKLISGLVPATSGSITVAGARVSRPLEIVGMAFQNPALLPWRTVIQNVLLPLEIVRPHRHEYRRNRANFMQRAQALLAIVGLSEVGDRYGWQLSGGMQQRVSLCRALIHEPQILLLDEPFGALDAFTREELWDVLQALWQRHQFTVLLVTHDLAEAVYLADRIHVMSNRPGRVIYTTTVDLPRPRVPDTRFEGAFVACVQDIRTQIGRARETA